MDNPETQATLSTRHRMKTIKTRNITQKTKKMSNTRKDAKNRRDINRYKLI